MGETFDPLNLVLLAAAVVVFWKLRSVLGRRTGHERKPFDPFSSKETTEKPADANGSGNVVTLPGRKPADTQMDADDDDRPPIWEGVAERGTPLAKTLEKIAGKDADFDPQKFLEGARMAYDMIVTAFAMGDRKALNSLLSSDVFEGFDQAIGERETRGDVVESTLVGIDKATLIDGSMKAKSASLTVKFISQIISATKDKEGHIIDGDPNKVREVTDIWTFMRDLTSRDPNWKLVATEAAN